MTKIAGKGELKVLVAGVGKQSHTIPYLKLCVEVQCTCLQIEQSSFKFLGKTLYSHGASLHSGASPLGSPWLLCRLCLYLTLTPNLKQTKMKNVFIVKFIMNQLIETSLYCFVLF